MAEAVALLLATPKYPKKPIKNITTPAVLAVFARLNKTEIVKQYAIMDIPNKKK